MRNEYNFSYARANPYASQLNRQVAIWLDDFTINYFKSLSEEIGIPYLMLISLYLRDCAANDRKLDLTPI